MFLCRNCRKLTKTTAPCDYCVKRTAALPTPELDGYEKDELVGEGSFGKVYRVRDGVGKAWALKVVDLHKVERSGLDPREARHAFRTEVEALQGLSNPHVVGYERHGEVEGLHYLLMEWIPTTLKDRPSSEGAWSLDEAVRLAGELADALAYLHARGVTHRDVNPANIGLDANRRLRLLDFGLAALREGWSERSGTLAGLGTLRYAPPEQLFTGQTGPASDTYAFGAVVYELLAGRQHLDDLPGRPQPGDQRAEAELLARYHRPPRPLPPDPARPPQLDYLLHRCLQPTVEHRVAAMWEVQQALEVVAKLLDERREFEGRLAALKAQAQAARTEADAAQASLDLARKSLDGVREQQRELEVQLARARKERKQLDATIDSDRQRREALSRDVEERKGVLDGLAAQVAKWQAAAGEAATAVAEAEARRQRAEGAAERARKQQEQAEAATRRAAEQPARVVAEQAEPRGRSAWPVLLLCVASGAAGVGAGYGLWGGLTAEVPTVSGRSDGAVTEQDERPPLATKSGSKPGLEPPAAPVVSPPDRSPEVVASARERSAAPSASSPPPDRSPEVVAPAPPGYVLIEPGKFQMGSPAEGQAGGPEAERGGDEVLHEVRLTRAYYMKTTEVTQGEWRSLMGNNPSGFQQCGDTCPVENVTWWEAVAYCNALSEKSGIEVCYTNFRGCNGKKVGEGYECEELDYRGPTCRGYRLPTEAEWEYAARGGTRTARYGEDLDVIAWYAGNSQSKTHPVAQKEANAFGLHDMLGNVWEWCWDWYAGYDKVPVEDPQGPEKGSNRVFRGGSWRGDAGNARAAYRYYWSPGNRNGVLGFRPSRLAP